MKTFNYRYPTTIYFGEGVTTQALEDELNKKGKNILFAFGQSSIKKNGIYDQVMQVLNKLEKNVTEFSGIMPNPTYDKVKEGAKLARDKHIDFILAVGGGSVIDCCKVVSAQALMDEDIWDYEYKDGKRPSVGIELGAVVTVSGTGAENNGGAVITYEQKNWKGGIFATVPCFAILDPQLTTTVSKSQLISGAFDTLSHAMETYFGNSDQDNVSDDVALAIMKNTVVNMKRILNDYQDMQARSNLMWDSAMAENGILKCGRVTDFQVHQIEHQLAAFNDCNHGQGLAIIHPAYYRFIKESANDRLVKMGQVVFNVDSADQCIDALQQFIIDCGLPSQLTQLKGSQPITKELLRKVADSTNLIKTNPQQLSHDDIYEILIQCM